MKPEWIIFIIGFWFGLGTGWLCLGLLFTIRDLRKIKDALDDQLSKRGGKP